MERALPTRQPFASPFASTDSSPVRSTRTATRTDYDLPAVLQRFRRVSFGRSFVSPLANVAGHGTAGARSRAPAGTVHPSCWELSVTTDTLPRFPSTPSSPTVCYCSR